jgi:glutamate synthase domain-containing protein 3
MAAILGAEEFEFGKLLLVAQGCVMARICEKNTCPKGIATHDQKFKAKYKVTKDHVVKLLHFLAEDVQRYLSRIGFKSLDEVRGRTDLLHANPKHTELIRNRNIDLGYFLRERSDDNSVRTELYFEGISVLNEQIVQDFKEFIDHDGSFQKTYPIHTTDRAATATLAGLIAGKVRQKRLKLIQAGTPTFEGLDSGVRAQLSFTGSAGQGFGVFMTDGMTLELEGEANDSVCKGMSGGLAVINPSRYAQFRPEENSIIGNCALYGATGGTLYVHGLAGDRFAVRNSGATAVVEGTGLHACEYMTNGKVVILGQTSSNVGAGMTGGVVYLYGDQTEHINHTYIAEAHISDSEYLELRQLLEDYGLKTGSNRVGSILKGWSDLKNGFRKYLPVKELNNVVSESLSDSNHQAA